MEDDERERSQQKLRKDDQYKLFIIILSFSFHGERSLKNYFDTVKKLAIHEFENGEHGFELSYLSRLSIHIYIWKIDQ